MKKVFTEQEEKIYTDRIFLDIFHEEGIDESELEQAICQSYNTDENTYNKISAIPMELKIEAITDTCELSGLAFEDYGDILNYFFDKYNNLCI